MLPKQFSAEDGADLFKLFKLTAISLTGMTLTSACGRPPGLPLLPLWNPPLPVELAIASLFLT